MGNIEKGFILKINRIFLCFVVFLYAFCWNWLHWCTVLLHPAKIEALRMSLRKGLEFCSSNGVDMQCRGVDGNAHTDLSETSLLCCSGGSKMDRTQIWWNLGIGWQSILSASCWRSHLHWEQLVIRSCRTHVKTRSEQPTRKYIKVNQLFYWVQRYQKKWSLDSFWLKRLPHNKSGCNITMTVKMWCIFLTYCTW